MNEYATLEQVTKYIGHGSADTADNELLMEFIRNASRSIDRYTRRKFYPRKESRIYNHPKDSQILKVDDDLLELITFKTQNGATTVASGVIWLGTGSEWNLSPYDRIVFDGSSGSVMSYSGTPQRANEVTAFWGYHENWNNGAWLDIGTSLVADYVASGGSISLAGAGSHGAGASDIDGHAPRLSVGDTLRIGDQFFSVTGGNASGNGSVLVRPHINGTSGTSAASGASIAKFIPEFDIQYATLRLAAYRYGQKDTPFQTKQGIFGTGSFTFEPESWPADVKDRIERFKRFTVNVIPGTT